MSDFNTMRSNSFDKLKRNLSKLKRDLKLAGSFEKSELSENNNAH